MTEETKDSVSIDDTDRLLEKMTAERNEAREGYRRQSQRLSLAEATARDVIAWCEGRATHLGNSDVEVAVRAAVQKARAEAVVHIDGVAEAKKLLTAFDGPERFTDPDGRVLVRGADSKYRWNGEYER